MGRRGQPSYKSGDLPKSYWFMLSRIEATSTAVRRVPASLLWLAPKPAALPVSIVVFFYSLKHKTMRSLYFILGLLLTTTSWLGAQHSAVVVVNGGIYGTTNYANVTIQTSGGGGAVTGVDTIRETSVQDLLIAPNGVEMYIAAKDSIIKYNFINNRPNITRVAAAAFGGPSTIKMALAGNKLLVGNWYAPFSHVGTYTNHLRIFDANTLAYIDSVPSVTKPAKDMIVIGNMAYIAQNNIGSNYNDTIGYIAVVDLNTNSLVRNDTLSTNGDEIGRMVLVGNTIYTLNGRSNTISTYNTITNAKSTVATTVNLQPRSYGKTVVMKNNGLAYIPYNDSIGIYDLINNQPLGGLISVPSSFAFDVDTSMNQIVVTETNFLDQTQNKGTVYNTQGDSLYAIQVGYSPELVAFILNIVVGTDQVADVTPAFELFPNPTADVLNIRLEEAKPVTWLALDALGRVIFREQTTTDIHSFDVSNLAPGTYILTALDEQGVLQSSRFVVQ